MIRLSKTFKTFDEVIAALKDVGYEDEIFDFFNDDSSSYSIDTYDDLLEEIQDMQMIIASEDRKIAKRAKKAAKKGKGYYNVNLEKRKVRQHVIGKMEETNWLDRIIQILKDIAPIIVVIARLVASLILSVLSVDEVKVNISKETLSKLNNIYSKAMVIA